MTELLTSAQMKATEQAAIESGRVTGLELMERAGQGVVDAIFQEWPELDRRRASPPTTGAGTDGAYHDDRSPGYCRSDERGPLRAVVLCGPGNNGGDGFVVARLLRELGWEVEVFLFGDPAKLPSDARVNFERWGGRTLRAGEKSGSDFQHPDLSVDALFGTGLTRSIEDPFLWEALWLHDDAIDAWDLRRAGAGTDTVPPRTVAIDIPSGLCSDSGRVLGGAYPDHGRRCARSALTVSFHSGKVGHVLAEAPDFCGRLVVKDIGLEPASEDAGIVQAVGGNFIAYLGKIAPEHKYSHGHALILSGGSGKSGAARLAARGALRIGAGLVTLGVPPSAQMEVASQVTAIMLQQVDGREALREVLKDGRLNALGLGPALGLERSRELVPVALAVGRATVLDADALSAFADDPAALLGQLHENCVLTPHGGEFARLFPDIAGKLNSVPGKGPAYSKVDAVREAAQRAGCVVLFKGPDTVIAAPDGRCSINSAHYDRSAPWLATAGSGDVLAGFITGLLARGFNPMRAAETAAWLHVECARAFGPGLIAEDLPETLPDILKQMNI